MPRILNRSGRWRIHFRHRVVTDDDGHRYTVTGLAVIHARSVADLRGVLRQMPEVL